MLGQEALQQHMNFYLNKMEQKFNDKQQKLNQLGLRLNQSAVKIQKAWKKHVAFKRFKAAFIIQRFWRKMLKKIAYRKGVLSKCTKTIMGLKIAWFILKVYKRKIPQKNIKISNRRSKIITQVVSLQARSYLSSISATDAQMHYIRKYAVYDKREFSKQWSEHESKLRQWMLSQIRKKWVRKAGSIWINQQQKQVDIEKFIGKIVQQTYLKKYSELQSSQQKLKANLQALAKQMQALRKIFYLTCER